MFSLKKIPITFKGELHDVQLVNFTLDRSELLPHVPPGLKILEYEKGRALISVVNVMLRKMRPDFLPPSLSFNYQHVAFRLLIDDSATTKNKPKGIYFIKSFTDKSIVVTGGKVLSEYKLSLAKLINKKNSFRLEQQNKFITYQIDPASPAEVDSKLTEHIAAVDRAYSVLDGAVRVTAIQREKWPIVPVRCTGFNTNFFNSAKLEGAFVVKEMIAYTWLPPRKVKTKGD